MEVLSEGNGEMGTRGTEDSIILIKSLGSDDWLKDMKI